MILLLDTPMFTLSGEPEGAVMYLHFQYKLDVFNREIYINLLDQWGLILDALKCQGVNQVRSIIPKSWHKVHKFQRMFGLSPTYESDNEIVYIMEV